MKTGRQGGNLAGFRRLYIGARIDANVVKLAFRDEDLFRVKQAME